MSPPLKLITALAISAILLIGCGRKEPPQPIADTVSNQSLTVTELLGHIV